MRNVIAEGIHLNLTTEECEMLFPWSKGGWKPYSVPLIDAKDITPIVLGDCSEFRFELPTARNIEDNGS